MNYSLTTYNTTVNEYSCHLTIISRVMWGWKNAILYPEPSENKWFLFEFVSSTVSLFSISRCSSSAHMDL